MIMPKKILLKAALGLEKADTVFKNALLFNPFTCGWEMQNFAVKDGIVLGDGDYEGKAETDLNGARVIPGLIDAHVHIESSLLTPQEYGRLVIQCGTTTVIADPHEIANVAGEAGIKYMIEEAEKATTDIFFMAPSCVPATGMDMGGAILNSEDIAALSVNKRIIGLGEMMNYPGVLMGDDEVYKKLRLFKIIDGHCPLLSGKELNAYIMQGISSDHECTNYAEAKEKLKKGMYIMLREGSTEKNLSELVPVVDSCNASRCMFATDDRHVDMLINFGHIDDCIRKAIKNGLKPELAYRMATLSAAERFGLFDRGAVSPGRIADFCVIDDSSEFRVLKTYKCGKEVLRQEYSKPKSLKTEFLIPGFEKTENFKEGFSKANIAGIIEGQIITKHIQKEINPALIPDLQNDLLKCVVFDRYRGKKAGTGIVHGFKMIKGAIASSVSHDSHNIVSVGCSDSEIAGAINLIKESDGGMSVFSDGKGCLLPLDCGGIMSSKSFEDVFAELEMLNKITGLTGSVENPFMYLSFLALTVIPEIRITERGVFDVKKFTDIPLFE